MKFTLLGICLALVIIAIKNGSTSKNDVDSAFKNHNSSIVNKLERGIKSLDSEKGSQATYINETFFIKGKRGIVENDLSLNDQKPPEKSQLLEDQKVFQNYLNEDYRWWIENFEMAQEFQNKLRKQKNDLGYGLNQSDKANLKTHLVLSIILNLSMAELMNVEDFEFSAYKWSLINNFVNSDDFNKMIKYKELNPVYLEFENLAMYYSNSRSVIRDENGKDLKKSTPSVEDDPEYIDSNDAD